jgi:hypothetical protein
MSVVIAVVESPRQTATPVDDRSSPQPTHRPARCLMAAAFEFHSAAGELQNPFCFGIEMLSAQNTKGTAAARLCRTKSCPITFSGFVAPRESKIAQASKLQTNMLSPKHPESARCPYPLSRAREAQAGHGPG